MIQVRHRFNNFLEKYAGHIGYSVRPCEQCKGYAKEMLKITLPFCREIRIDKVLIVFIDGNSAAIKHFGLTKTSWHSEDEVPYSDAHSTLAALHDKGYKLGIIANQKLGTAKRLGTWGLARGLRIIKLTRYLNFFTFYKTGRIEEILWLTYFSKPTITSFRTVSAEC